MRERFAGLPWALRKKLLGFPAAGAAILLVGSACSLATGDRVLLLMSLALAGACVLKAVFFYRQVAAVGYDLLEGQCVALEAPPLRRFRVASIRDSEGIETSIRLDKRQRLRIGGQYRFYFKKCTSLPGNGYPDALVASGLLLGMEAVENGRNL